MRKLSLIFLLCLITFGGYPQSAFKIHSPEFVECYYPNEIQSPLAIYDGMLGNPIDSLKNIHKFCWYKLAIQSSENGWFKIENLMIIPGCEDHPNNKDINRYKDKWVKSEDLLINLPEFGTDLYKEANLNSELIRVNKFAKGILLEVKGQWAKVRIDMADENTLEAWLKRSDQCALPYTSCNWEIEEDSSENKDHQQ